MMWGSAAMKPPETLLEQRCDRCEGWLEEGSLSFFTDERLCPACATEEQRLIGRLRLKGIDPAKLAGSGVVPQDDLGEGEHENQGPSPGV
jgi:hypothetical protein